jgi:hypothetical protein
VRPNPNFVKIIVTKSKVDHAFVSVLYDFLKIYYAAAKSHHDPDKVKIAGMNVYNNVGKVS